MSKSQQKRICAQTDCAVRDELRQQLQQCRKERDEADKRAGAAERKNGQLTKEAQARAEWLSKAKRDAGYDDSVSFDVIWKAALANLEDE